MRAESDKNEAGDKQGKTRSRQKPAVGFQWPGRYVEPTFIRLFCLKLPNNPFSPRWSIQPTSPSNSRSASGRASSFDAPFREGRMQEGAHRAVKFLLKRPDEFRQARAKSGNVHGLNSFLPGILIIGGDGDRLPREACAG